MVSESELTKTEELLRKLRCKLIQSVPFLNFRTYKLQFVCFLKSTINWHLNNSIHFQILWSHHWPKTSSKSWLKLPVVSARSNRNSSRLSSRYSKEVQVPDRKSLLCPDSNRSLSRFSKRWFARPDSANRRTVCPTKWWIRPSRPSSGAPWTLMIAPSCRSVVWWNILCLNLMSRFKSEDP